MHGPLEIDEPRLDASPPTDPSDVRSVRPPRRRQGPIRIALVDDHHLVREGLRLVLNSVDGFEVVGEAATHDEAFDLVASTHPDILVLDLTFPEGDGLPLLRALGTLHPDLRVVVLTMDRGSETVRQALVAGARG
jgi:DNA-binding NarL/FixJ family response regulator